jgi:hypothetical protein
MRSAWQDLRPKWRIAVMLARGPSDYYNLDITDGEVAKWRSVQLLAEHIDGLEGDDWDVGHHQLRRAETPYEIAIRDCIGFLADTAQLVARGRLSIDDAYAVCGREVIRQARPIRVLLGYPVASQGFEKMEEADERGGGYELETDWEYGLQRPLTGGDWHSWIDYYPAVRTRTFALLDLLWALAVRDGDIEAAEAKQIARHKRRSSGRACRVRVAKSCMHFRSPVRAMRLTFLLTYAEHPPHVRSWRATPARLKKALILDPRRWRTMLGTVVVIAALLGAAGWFLSRGATPLGSPTNHPAAGFPSIWRPSGHSARWRLRDSAADGPLDTRFRFVDRWAFPSQRLIVVARCDRGRLTVASRSVRCVGGTREVAIGKMPRQFEVRVSEHQLHAWGIAIYSRAV